MINYVKTWEELHTELANAQGLLRASLKWIRRLEERKDDIPSTFFDGNDPFPLRKAIEAHLKGS